MESTVAVMLRGILVSWFVGGKLEFKQLLRVHAPRIPFGRKTHEIHEFELSYHDLDPFRWTVVSQ
jgi:hypothetical protein